MGNTITRISKLGRATMMAALTTPLVLSLALLSYYKNNRIIKQLPRSSKSVRFNDTVTSHEVETVEVIDPPVSKKGNVKESSANVEEVKTLLPNTEASVVLTATLEAGVEAERSVIDVEKKAAAGGSEVTDSQEGPHTWNIRDTAELKKMKNHQSQVDPASFQRVQRRQENVLRHLEAIQRRIETLENENRPTITVTTPPVSLVEQRVMDACKQIGLKSAKMFRVPSDYYSWKLEERRKILNAPSVHHLCKSIILENTQCIYSDCSHPENSRFYCVILQYTARFQSHKLFKFVRQLVKDAPKKNYHFAYAKEEDSLRLTGFEHNAITPIGTATKIPVILSHKITQLSPKLYFLGGGEVELKLCVEVDEFINTVKPFVVDVTMDGVSDCE